jgi:hypothetical protein
MRACTSGAVAALGLSIGLFAYEPSSLGQAGSTGGTVGKQDKSISGAGDEPESSRLAAPRHKSTEAPLSKSSKTADRCGHFAGSYSAPFNTVSIYKSDGTAANSAGLQATWTCTAGVVIVNWNTGYVDHLSLSGGSGYSASNNHGWTWSAKRM